jgi:hypothetical protein
MNNTFNFRRFGLLLRKTIYEKGLVLGGTFILVTILIMFSYSSTSTNRQSSFSQSMGLVIGLFSVTVWVNILLNNFSKKSAAASYLSLPCSHFEKWLSVFVITIFMYLPLFLVVFKVIDTLFLNHFRDLAISKFHYSTKQLETDLPYLTYNFIEKDNLNRMPFSIFLACFFSLGGVAVIGSLYFNQKSYIKSALVFLGLAFTLSLALNMLFDTIIGEKTSTGIFSFTKAVITTENERLFTINASESIQQIGKYFIMIFIPAALWLIGLVRFSDKEL